MINTAAITAALKSQIEKNLPLTTADQRSYRVERGQTLNVTPDATPWVGVYRDTVHYEPRTLGRAANHLMATVTLRVLVLAATTRDGEDLDDLIGEYVKDVLDAIETDETIGGTVNAIMETVVDQIFDEEEPGAEFISWAVITLTAEVNTQ